MAGLNLSSSTPEKNQEQSGIFRGSFLVVIIFSCMLLLWGGMQWYLKTLDDTIASKEALLTENSSKLTGENVDRVVSFDSRLTLAKKQVTENALETKIYLDQLESLVIPSIQITKYELNKKDNVVLVEGETDNFKYVAQQLISFKKDPLFAGIYVSTLKKNAEGRIIFSFKAEFN